MKVGTDMPAKAKVTKEMIIDAAFEIAKEMGAENINARTVSQKLSCSTQPVLYHFKASVDVPKTAIGGRCEINTHAGDIKIKIE